MTTPSTTAPRTRRRPGLERVLAAADRLYYEHGILATGVDAVAEEAKVSKATMYTYFRSRDELALAYLQARSDAWRQRLEAELATVDEGEALPRRRMLRVYAVLGAWFAEPGFRGCPFINAEAECPTVPGLHETTLGHRAWVRGLFDGLAREAGLRDADGVARRLTVLYDGAMASAQSEPSIDWAGEAAEAAASVWDAAAR